MAAQETTGFTEEERAAMRERAKETKAAKKRSGKADGESALLEKIAEMADPDRAIAEKVHAIVKANAPDLIPTTWYGMPAYNNGKQAVVFFQPALKFKARYATLGFNDQATLDDGGMWPVAYALTEVTPAIEKKIAELVKKAAG